MTKEIAGEAHMKKWNVGIKAGVFFLLCVWNIGWLCFLIRLLVSNQKRLITLRKEREVLSQEQSYRKQVPEMLHSNEAKLWQLKQGLQEDFEGLLHLMETGENHRVMEILQEKREIVKEVSSFVHTQSMVSRAARHHIRITSMLPEDFTGIEEYDLSSLLTNMLDNAIEGCLQVPGGRERTMHLNITSEGKPGEEAEGCSSGRIYIFQTENTTAGQIKRKNPTLFTTKKEKENHGYGTGIIRDIARKYHGNAEFFDKKDSFCCRVVLFTGYQK